MRKARKSNSKHTISARNLNMSSSQSGSGSYRQSSTSCLSRLLRKDQNPLAGDSSDNEDFCGRASRSIHRRQDPSPSRAPFSSSLNQTAPARSYFQRPVNGSYGKLTPPHENDDLHLLIVASTRGHSSDKFTRRSRRHC